MLLQIMNRIYGKKTVKDFNLMSRFPGSSGDSGRSGRRKVKGIGGNDQYVHGNVLSNSIGFDLTVEDFRSVMRTLKNTGKEMMFLPANTRHGADAFAGFRF